MTSRGDYTTPEWNTLQAAVVGVKYYVHKLTPGFFDKWRAKHAAEEAIDEAQDSNMQFFQDLCDIDDFKSPFPKHVTKSKVAVEAFVLQVIDEALNILTEKDPNIMPAYKHLLLDIANEAADEVDGISQQENDAIAKISRVVNGQLYFTDSWRMSEPFAYKPKDDATLEKARE